MHGRHLNQGHVVHWVGVLREKKHSNNYLHLKRFLSVINFWTCGSFPSFAWIEKNLSQLFINNTLDHPKSKSKHLTLKLWSFSVGNQFYWQFRSFARGRITIFFSPPGKQRHVSSWSLGSSSECGTWWLPRCHRWQQFHERPPVKTTNTDHQKQCRALTCRMNTTSLGNNGFLTNSQLSLTPKMKMKICFTHK